MSLREVIKGQVQNATNIPQGTKLTDENNQLRTILKQLGFNIEDKLTPDEWIKIRDEKVIQGRESEWERLAVEESLRADDKAHKVNVLEHQLAQQQLYIQSLESRFTSETHESLRKEYDEKQWNTQVMDIEEIMIYLSRNSEVATLHKEKIIKSIDRLIDNKIGKFICSSTNDTSVGMGSGHTINHVIIRLLRFIQKQIANNQHEYLTLSWKEITRRYVDSIGTGQGVKFQTSFPCILKALPEESGNITNIEALLVGISAIEAKIDSDFKGLCGKIERKFKEENLTLYRQIFPNKNGIVGQ
ncbi:MAG: hypothetical protein WC774_03595 [Candidatus Gracilibacteria bacterium]